MVNLRVLVANEPRAYREVLAATFQALRPATDVTLIEPEDLDEVVALGLPHLVVSSRAGATTPTGPYTWVVLYPGHVRQVVVRTGGRETSLPELELDGMLALLDETAQLAHAH